MNRAVGFIVAAAIVGSGCGEDGGPPALTQDQLLERLRGLDGVTVEKATLPDDTTVPKTVSYYILHFTQPIDHDHAELGTYQQEVALLHRDDRAPTPMIVSTSGYSDSWGDQRAELTELLDANQVSIEHRFYGSSRPETVDWSKLTIRQMASDEHAIIAALRTIYGGAFLTTGGSKGGMTAVFHRRFFPDDVEGTVAYAAPLSFGRPDPRYPPQFNKIGTDDCRQKVRDAARAMLVRRAAILALAQAQAVADPQEPHVYTRVQIDPAVEAAISGVEWGFWQMWGVNDCNIVPLATASDEDLFEFLDDVSPVTDYDDDRVGYFEPYVYQTYAQLGFPDCTVEYLKPDLLYTAADYTGELPVSGEVPYDDEAMRDIDHWVENDGDRVMFIYGDWDPWFAGRFVQGSGKSVAFVQHEGTHRIQLKGLDTFKRDPALATIAAWTGVEPVLPRTPRPPARARGAAQERRLATLPLRALAARR
jgi:hypothetical protein